MRNLKRVLSLALALVMVLGMMVITTSAADFTAADEITNVEAVDVISAIGVITGDNGSFYPNRTLTREEGAALICYILMGKDKADKLAGSGNFADVAANRWSAGEIDYCANLGIIKGYTNAAGEQVFNPKGELTAVAYGRMLLGALGYDGDIEGYTGGNWASAIAVDMIEAGLEVNGVAMDATLTREQAAQMTLQALQATMVEYDEKGSSITIGGVEIVNGASDAEPKAALKDSEGADIDYSANTAGDGTLQLCEKYFSELAKGTGTDNLGRPSTKWTYGKFTGIYAKKAAATYVVTNAAATLEDIAEELDVTLADDVDETTKYAVGTVLELFKTGKVIDTIVPYSYVAVKVADVETIDDEDELYEEYNATKTYTLKTLDGELYEVYDTEYVDTLAESKTGYTAIGDWGKNDVIILYVGAEKATVAGEAEVVTGVKTAQKTSAAKYIKIDGAKYSTADVYGADYTTTYNWYLDPNGIVIDATVYQDNSALSYAYVVDMDMTTSGDLLAGTEDRAVVKVMYTDGTSEVVDYALTFTKDRETYSSGYYFKVGANKYDLSVFESTIENGWYAYTKNEAGEITLKSAEKANTSDVIDITAEKGEKTVADELYANTSTTVTVLGRTGIVKSYTGYKSFPATAISAEDALVMYKSSTASAIYIYDASAQADAETIDVAIFVGTGESSNDGIEATFYVAGEKVSYVVDPAEVAGAAKGTLYEIEIDDDEASVTPLAGTTAVIDVVSDDYVVDTDGNEYDLADKYSVWQMNAANTKATTGELESDDVVVMVLNRDDEVVEIVIYKNSPYGSENTTIITDAEAMEEALAEEGAVVLLAAGEWTLPETIAEGAVIAGSGSGTVLVGGEDGKVLTGDVNDLTLKNLTMVDTYAIRECEVAEGCTITLEDCTIEGDVYALNIIGPGKVVIKNCDITGWCSFGSDLESVTIENCNFYANGTYGIVRVYCDATITDCTFDYEDVDTTDDYQEGIDVVTDDTPTVVVTDCTNVNGEIEDLFEAADLEYEGLTIE